ncbi:cation diffusion facilitator family transporter [Mucilaginibacter pineti]|uniref:Cation diffusion facilitator family transporter n=1 Tax=Mucilaginibacter pineti TaxID=1391627 RepID=A0A1G7GE02_9SPHI|nr:cation diffusion facilitator family transporter [Mucilaginibacter pineti]SDE86239.1 cation diffusion facilitator family transporter [Mucilaginibacter pineti]
MASIDLHPSERAIRTTQLGIAISLVLVFLKAISGYLGHSYALIADATETGADVFSSALLWIGLRIAMKPADADHPYGHGKAEPLVSIVISMFLMAAAIWIGWHAIEFIRTPHTLPKKFTLAVLFVVIIIKETMFRYVLKVGKEIKSNAVKADAYHHRSDAITSIAALIGIIIALIGGKGYEGADDWAALIASVLIMYNAIQLMRPGLAEIMDAAPSTEMVDKVRILASGIAHVEAVEKCYIRKMGFEYFVDLHIQVAADLSVAEGHAIAHQVKDSLLNSGLSVKDVLIHVEPFNRNKV